MLLILLLLLLLLFCIIYLFFFFGYFSQLRSSMIHFLHGRRHNDFYFTLFSPMIINSSENFYF